MRIRKHWSSSRPATVEPTPISPSPDVTEEDEIAFHLIETSDRNARTVFIQPRQGPGGLQVEIAHVVISDDGSSEEESDKNSVRCDDRNRTRKDLIRRFRSKTNNVLRMPTLTSVGSTGDFQGASSGDKGKMAADIDSDASADHELPIKKRKNWKMQMDSEDESHDAKSKVASFPSGWAYKGLAVIAEKDGEISGKQCGRTDGRFWRCPLRAVIGYSLCQHHQLKFVAKKLRTSLARDEKRKKPTPIDEVESSPAHVKRHEDSDSGGSHVKTRRRHKTVKLSVL